jgi:hypothetical protein
MKNLRKLSGPVESALSWAFSYLGDAFVRGFNFGCNIQENTIEAVRAF